MRHGWKTRIEERRYFEEKKDLREQQSALMHLAKVQREYDLRLHLLKARERNEIN